MPEKRPGDDEKRLYGMRVVTDERVPPDRLALVQPGIPPKLLGVLIGLPVIKQIEEAESE